VILYWAVPYLLAAAPPAIVLLTFLIGGCTMTATGSPPVDHARFSAIERNVGAKS
jgi:hypothetical protein